MYNNQPQQMIPTYSSYPQPPVVHWQPTMPTVPLELLWREWKEMVREGAYSHIEQHSDMLYVPDRQGRRRCILEAKVEYAFYFCPDPVFGQEPFYMIRFVNGSECLVLTEKQFQRSSSLLTALSRASGAQVYQYTSAKQTASLLQNYFAKICQRVFIPYYAGWQKTDSGWHYSLVSGKTHQTRPLLQAKHFTVRPEPLSIEPAHGLIAAEQICRMLHCIENEDLRSIVSLWYHCAALYSLLEDLGYRIPVGLCLHCNDASGKECLSQLFSWYNDPAITMSEAPKSFKNLLVERKDQPLLIASAAGQRENEQALIQNISTGHILSDSSLRLQALPTVLSTDVTALGCSSSLVTISVDSDDFTDGAIAQVSALKQYHPGYLASFASFVESHVDLVTDLLHKGSLWAIETFGDLLDLTTDSVKLMGIFNAVERLIEEFCASLAPGNDLECLFGALVSPEWHHYLEELIADIDVCEDFGDLADLFLHVVRNKLSAGELNLIALDSREGYPKTNKALVYYTHSTLCLNRIAFRQICRICGISVPTMIKALQAAQLLTGATVNSTTATSRIHLYDVYGKPFSQSVYKIKRTGTLYPEAQHIPSGTGDYRLHLGTDTKGEPITCSNVPNGHLLITGSTGAGKTYLLRKLIRQVKGQHVRCFVFDWTGEYACASAEWSVSDLEVVNVKTEMGFNPFTPFSPDDSNTDIARRVTGIIEKARKLGERQREDTIDTIKAALDHNVRSFEGLFQFANNHQPLPLYLPTKLRVLADYLPERDTEYFWNLDEPGVTVLNLHSFPDSTDKRVIYELLLNALCARRMATSLRKYLPVVLVLDECHNIRLKEGSVGQWILREGRKWGFCGWYCTQYIESKEVSNALRQAAGRIYFRQNEDSARHAARMIAGSNRAEMEDMRIKLSSLERGCFFFQAGSYLVQSDSSQFSPFV